MINSDQFRQTEQFRIQLGEFLNSDTGMIVVRILKDKGRPTDVPSNTDALASVRVLSHFHGFNSAIDELESLAQPFAHPIAPLESTFGSLETDHL